MESRNHIDSGELQLNTNSRSPGRFFIQEYCAQGSPKNQKLLTNARDNKVKHLKKAHKALKADMSSMKSGYTMTVNESIRVGSKKFNQIGGIPGLEHKLWNHDVDKSKAVKFLPEGRPRSFLDQYLKVKKSVPPPNQYNVT